MSNAADVMDFNVLAMVPGAEYERLARLRQRQRRQRKEELYSPRARKHKGSN